MTENIFFFSVMFVLFIFSAVKVFFIFHGKVSDGGLLGFAVDSAENIYLGTRNCIRVYRGMELIRTISPPSLQTYRFFMENNQLIISGVISKTSQVLDLEGRHIRPGKLSYYEVKKVGTRTRVNVNGHEFRLIYRWIISPYKITRDGVIIHRMSAIDYVFNGLPFWSVWVCACVAIVLIFFFC